MNVLVVTGQLAEAAVKKAVLESADVLVLPIAVASLITPQKLISGFQNSVFSQKKYDAVLISGFSKFNFSKAEAEIGCPIFLGPKHAADFKEVLKLDIFSKTIPACEFIKNEKKEQAREMLEKRRHDETFSFKIDSVSIGGNSKMKVLAEIVSAEYLSLPELESQIKYLVSEGADMIDIGFSPDADAQIVSEIISYAKSVCSVPLSIDSSDFLQISAGLDSGVDLVLSANSQILDFFGKNLSSFSFDFEKTAFVIIPDLFSSRNKIESLEKNIETAQKLGIKKIIADPILSPPGKNFLPSLQDYSVFHQRNPEIPILFGAGNVTELFDADSVGMNALLVQIAKECGASVLFTPNAGDKGKGSIRELKTASDMMILSEIRESSPKDLGIDLLILKEKRKRPDFNLELISGSEAFHSLHLKDDEIETSENISDFSFTPPYSSNENKSLVLTGTLNPDFVSGTKWGWKPDKSGNFLIGLISVSDLIDYLTSVSAFHSASEIQMLESISTPETRVILAVHPTRIIVGTDSAFMLETILNENLISEISHAGYLGRELQKAEIALLLGRSYSQDDSF